MDERRQPALRRLWIGVISALCVVGHGATVRAQSAEAEAMFTDGDKLMKAGKTAEACDAFESSNRIEPRAGTLIRLGECREQNHQLASAWSAYKDALTRVKDAKKKAIAAARIKDLEARLSYLTVSVPDDSRVDELALTRNGQSLDAGLWNRAVPVNGGQYEIGGRAPGHEEWRTTVTVPDEGGKVSVEVPKFKEISKLRPVPPDRPPVAAGRTAAASEVDAGEPSARWTTKRKVAIAAGGVAVIGIAAGIVLGTQATGKRDDAHKLCPDDATPCAGADQAESLIKAAQSRALGANLAFGVAGAAVIAAGVLWFTGAPEHAPHGVAVVPSISAGAAALAVSGKF